MEDPSSAQSLVGLGGGRTCIPFKELPVCFNFIFSGIQINISQQPSPSCIFRHATVGLDEK
jgi:hypothetical protein